MGYILFVFELVQHISRGTPFDLRLCVTDVPSSVSKVPWPVQPQRTTVLALVMRRKQSLSPKGSLHLDYEKEGVRLRRRAGFGLRWRSLDRSRSMCPLLRPPRVEPAPGPASRATAPAPGPLLCALQSTGDPGLGLLSVQRAFSGRRWLMGPPRRGHSPVWWRRRLVGWLQALCPSWVSAALSFSSLGKFLCILSPAPLPSLFWALGCVYLTLPFTLLR